MLPLSLLVVFGAFISVVSPSPDDPVQIRTHPLATSLETSNEFNVVNGPNASAGSCRELRVFPLNSPLQGAKGEGRWEIDCRYFSQLKVVLSSQSLLSQELPSVAVVTGSRAEGTKKNATLISHLPVVGVFIFVLFFALAFVYRYSYIYSGSSIRSSFDCTSTKRQSRQTVMLLVISFLVVVAIAKVDGLKLELPEVPADSPSCEECPFPFECNSRRLCLFISSWSSNWFDAETDCFNRGATLVSIANKEDLSDLEEYLRKVAFNTWPKLSRKELFLGLTRTPAAVEGTYNYQWADGLPVSIGTRWISGWYYSRGPVCFSVIVHRINGDMLETIEDVLIEWGKPTSCSEKRQYICQKLPKIQRLADYPIRLVGLTPNRGFLEMFYKGAWTPVCMQRERREVMLMAAGACRKMGYVDVLDVALNHLPSGYSGYCSFINCKSKWFGASNCTASGVVAPDNNVVFVSCRAIVVDTITVSLSAGGSQLTNKQGRYWVPGFGEGVNIVFGGSSTKLCGNSVKNAELLCREFGYEGHVSHSLTDYSIRGVRMSCGRDAKSIDECTFSEESICGDTHIDCYHAEGEVRFVDGLREREGSVEVYWSGFIIYEMETPLSSGLIEILPITLDPPFWSVVCADEWDLEDANVVCRQLGYKKAVALSAKRRGSRILSPRKATFFDAHCNGNETTFRDCNNPYTPTCNSKDAEVTCEERVNEYCPRGWHLYADYCYTVSRKFYTFDDTEWDKGCSSKSLVSISSPHEQAFVLPLLSDSDTADVWIGLKRDADQFHWVNGDRMTYARWASGEPRFNHLLECVSIDSRTGYWKAAYCRSSKKRLCKKLLVDFRKEARRKKWPFHYRCQKDEIHFNDACYYLSKDDDKPESIARAVKKCESRWSQLASISSIHENAFIAKETSAMAGPIYWIGLVYNNTSSAFEWLDGLPVSFSHWAKYEPTYENGECVAFGFDGREFTWSVLNCTAKAGHVCKRLLPDSNMSGSAVKLMSKSALNYVSMCPNDWTKIGNRCFKLFDTSKTWRESLADCQQFSQNDGTLASIHFLLEQKLLSNLLGTNDAWIGLNDLDNEGFYVWADGSPFVYANWSSAEKMNFSLKISHSCIAANGRFWKARDCIEQKQSVCVMQVVSDFDECRNKSYNCHENGTCQNTLGSYECICKPGFEGNGTECKDLDECRGVPNHNCYKKGQVCVNTVGSYKCDCGEGWRRDDLSALAGLAADEFTCDDIDECKVAGQCHWGANCINTDGSFDCMCLTGFIGDGRNCTDVDECSKETNNCHRYATCNNTIGSYQCKCNDGHAGNGTHCQASQISQVTVILSAVGSFVFFVFLIVIAVTSCFRFSSDKRRFAELLSWPASGPFRIRDKWEINPGDMMLLEKIGEGLFGVVLKAQLLHRLEFRKTLRHRTGNGSRKKQTSLVACKMLKGKSELEDDFLQEINLMKGIGRHQHIVSMLACITKRNPLCLIVEYCCQGDLLNYLRKGRHASPGGQSIVNSVDDLEPSPKELEQNEDEDRERSTNEVENVDIDKSDDKAEGGDETIALKFTTSDLLSFAWQIASGMDYLSGKGLVHRDLACRNVLVGKKTVLKVSDFGYPTSFPATDRLNSPLRKLLSDIFACQQETSSKRFRKRDLSSLYLVYRQ